MVYITNPDHVGSDIMLKVSRKFKKNCLEKHDQLIKSQEVYHKRNGAEINSNETKRRETDISYRLIKNTRCIIYHVLNSKTKSSSILDIFAIDIET